MDSKALQKTGLNNSEAQIYLKLIEIGSCKAGRLAKETEFNRTTIYKALDSLIQKGLVSFVLKENRKYFEATNPNILLENVDKEEDLLKQKKQEIKELLPKLIKQYETNKDELEANVFKSAKGIRAIFEDILKTLKEGDEYLAFGVPQHAESIWGYFEDFNKKLQKNKVKSKIIFDERAKENIKSCKKYGYEVRTLSKEFFSPAEINIYKNKVAIIIWQPIPFGMIIKGEGVVKSFKQYFKLMWKIAKK